MRRELLVGDPHTTVEDLEDSGRLFDLIEETAKAYKVDRVTILGDLHHNFSITNVKVTAFYKERFYRLTQQGVPVLLLVGNHDMTGDGKPYPHALLPYGNAGVVVVDKPLLERGVLYLPYFSDPNLLIEVCRERKANTVVCHQEFNGATYDNGFYAPHGIDPKLVESEIISGHIHTPQSFANVWYPGAPRWRTISDAGHARAIWVVEFDDVGRVVSKSSIDTSKACRVIKTAVVSAGGRAHEAAIPAMDPKDDWRLTIQGPADFVQEKVAWLKENAPFARWSTIIIDQRIAVRESEGVEVAFKKYAEAYVPKHGTSKEVLAKMAMERVYG
jgi:DNA repair exonuclease SbcCD nuclease subunit